QNALLPAADPAAETPLFGTVEDTRSAPYLAFRRRLAEVMREELGIGAPGMARERAAAVTRDALTVAVEQHEIQQQLDHRRARPVRAVRGGGTAREPAPARSAARAPAHRPLSRAGWVAGRRTPGARGHVRALGAPGSARARPPGRAHHPGRAGVERVHGRVR